MKNFNIKIYFDKDANDLLDFRKRIFTNDLNCDLKNLVEPKNQIEIKNSVAPENGEDAYKFSFGKWNQTQFDAIFALMDEERIVGVSGCKSYGPYLRISMHMYLLKAFRGKYINLKYCEGGFVDHQIEWAQERGLKALFFTIYPHNRKTRALLKNHQDRTISTASKSEIRHKSKFLLWPEPLLFNQVEQYFFYMSLQEDVGFDISQIVNSKL